jgi:hypothetical protein
MAGKRHGMCELALRVFVLAASEGLTVHAPGDGSITITISAAGNPKHLQIQLSPKICVIRHWLA